MLALFNRIPFINGGLFDCLDTELAEVEGGYRIDCFTDNPKQRAGYSIPNQLFFDDPGGLFPLLNRYKFTVEENTPIEEEVALDPELLGKAFENLLAAHNPETRDRVVNDRKQSGSFYTPRVVVEYMVDQSLLALLSQQVAPDDGNVTHWHARLSKLLDYEAAVDEANIPFSTTERERLVQTICGA